MPYEQILAAAGVLKPETIDAAGGLVEKTGNGVKTVFSGITDPLTQAQKTEADRQVAETEALAKMSPDQMKIWLDHKKAASGQSPLRTLASFTPLGPVLAIKDMIQPS